MLVNESVFFSLTNSFFPPYLCYPWLCTIMESFNLLADALKPSIKGTEEELRSIELGGNIIVNSAYEAKQVIGRPEQRAMLNPRKTFLKDKYVERKYLDTDRLEEVLRQITLHFRRKRPQDCCARYSRCH